MPSAPLLKSPHRAPVTAARSRLEQARTDSSGDRPCKQLWLALCLPELPLEALCRGGIQDDPTVVIADGSARAEVVAVNDKAGAAGVRPGMPLPAACALAPSIRALMRDESEEATALEGLALWCGQFTALVSLERQSLLLEIGGSLKLFGGLDALCTRIAEGVSALGYRALTGVAPTPLAASLLARAGFDEPVISPALLSGRLASVPVSCLDLDTRALEDLRRMGVRSLGDCCRLPRDGLARRISPKLVEVMDRALGRRPDPRPSYIPPPVFERCIHLSFEARDTGVLSTAAKRLFTELHGFLSARAGGVQSLEVHLGHRRPPATRLTLSLAAAGRDAAQLLKLFEARMAGFSLGAPVTYFGVRATRILPLAQDNRDLYKPAGASGADWQTLLAQLQARLSAENVHAVSICADYRPERAWKKDRVHQRGSEAGFPLPFSPLPLWLLDQPRVLKVVHGAPCWHGPLMLRQGPQRVESGWWDESMARDYYVAVGFNNARLWIFRELRAPQRWYLHGVFG